MHNYGSINNDPNNHRSAQPCRSEEIAIHTSGFFALYLLVMSTVHHVWLAFIPIQYVQLDTPSLLHLTTRGTITSCHLYIYIAPWHSAEMYMCIQLCHFVIPSLLPHWTQDMICTTVLLASFRTYYIAGEIASYSYCGLHLSRFWLWWAAFPISCSNTAHVKFLGGTTTAAVGSGLHTIGLHAHSYIQSISSI